MSLLQLLSIPVSTIHLPRLYTCGYSATNKIVGLSLAGAFGLLLLLTFIRACRALSRPHSKRLYSTAAFVLLQLAIICTVSAYECRNSQDPRLFGPRGD